MRKLFYTFNFLLLTLIIALLLSAGCKKKESKVPNGVLGKEQMVKVMLDVNLTEAAFRIHPPFNSKDTIDINVYYEKIFKKYKITKQQFNKSLDYYTKHPDKFGDIYDEVINRLSRIQSEEKSKK
jgi:hypothetical protein